MPPDDKKAGPAFEPDAADKEPAWRLGLANVDVDLPSGSFRVRDHRLLVLRPEALVDLQKHLEDTIGLSSKGFLYLAGEKSARQGHDLFAPPATPAPAASDSFESLRNRIAAMSLLGWGRFSVFVEDAAAHRYLVNLENSPIAEAYGTSKKPVCHLIAGWIAGTAESALGENLLCEEIACGSQGKLRCEFRLRPTPYG